LIPIFKKGHKGISLLEIVIALLIFGIAAVGILRSFIFCNMRAKSTSLRTAAIALAQGTIERIDNDAFANITAAIYPGDNPTLDDAGTADTGDDLTGMRTVAITIVAADLRNITVTVAWNFRGNPLSESLSTVKTMY